MTTLTLNCDNGTKLTLEEEEIVFFIDETGHELMSDKNHPVFGIGGCGMTVKHYVEVVRPTWIKLKTKFGFNEKDSFHAADIKKDKICTYQADLKQFFETIEFFRVAAVVGNKSNFKNGAIPVEVVCGALKLRIVSVLNNFVLNFSTVTVCFESSERLNPEFVRNFHDFNLEKPGTVLSVNKFFLPKVACEAGLEIADFIMHSSGAQASKRTNNGIADKRIDFSAIWSSIKKDFTSYLFITEAVVNKN
jgi:hypothetical protein